MDELRTPGEVAAETGDLLVRWAAQALTPEYPHKHGSAWRHGSAVAVYAPKLNRGDRVAFTGGADDAAELLARVLPGIGDSRPLAATPLAHQVASRLGLRVRATFGWMEQITASPDLSTMDVEWLAEGDTEAITVLLRRASPRSYTFPGDPGVRRWAGIRESNGDLVAVAADSWPAPGIGFLSGVATHPDRRGAGLSTRVCGFLARELARDATVTLMVDADNPAAITLYRRLGFRYRSVTALAG